jgi:hypothetical protein
MAQNEKMKPKGKVSRFAAGLRRRQFSCNMSTVASPDVAQWLELNESWRMSMWNYSSSRLGGGAAMGAEKATAAVLRVTGRLRLERA